ncbi:MAG: phosphoglucosamine mutase [Candidatus Methanomethylophilaceae archaeon]
MNVSSGSSGVRGIVNDGMDVELALQIGKIAGERYSGPVAVAHDTRISGETFKSAVSAGLMAVGCEVVDLGSLPTPVFQYYVRTHDDIVGGVMVTASHNPPEFNGVKLISANGLEDPFLMDDSVDAIRETDARQVPWERIGEMRQVDGCIEEYIDAVLSHVDTDAISEAGLKICVDCANGSAFLVVPEILHRLNVRMVTMNGSSLGELTGHDSELTSKNLENLGYMVVHSECDLGVAFDVDADRCLFVSSNGEMVPGDKSLALLARSTLSKRKGKVVTTVASSSAVEDEVDANGGILKYVAVGAPNIVKKVMEYDAILGGEVNGGVVFPEHQLCRDAPMALVRMLEIVAKGGPLSEQVSTIKTYYSRNISVPCADSCKDDVETHFKEVAHGMQTDTTDGVKMFFDDGWVLLRASATDSLFRIYSQSTDPAIADRRLAEYTEAVNGYLSS